MNTVNLPSDPKLAGKVIDAQAGHDAALLEAGWMGKIFGGSRSGAASNAASFIVYGSFFLLTIIFFAPVETASFSKKDMFTAISSLTTLSLGFLFGKGAKL